MAATDNNSSLQSEGVQTSPYLRPSSPSPSVTPSLALGACPLLDRSASTPSTASSFSSRSVSTASDGSITGTNRRRGYMRPQGTDFADSARNRDSVLCLGSIAHMQNYFARTGLLDGKGAQLSRGRKKLGEDSVTIVDQEGPSPESENISGFQEWSTTGDGTYLPPTVSTYKEKPIYAQPPPDVTVLRRELKESLDDARKVMEEVETQSEETRVAEHQEHQGFFEIQGLHILDLVTLAIRAAKNYYTCHNNPQKLYSIRPEKEIRADLYQVMDTLKRMANREFRGGMRDVEQLSITSWIQSIEDVLRDEQEAEKKELEQLEQWTWLRGDWTGRGRQREQLFFNSFDPDMQSLPSWTTPTEEPSPFLKSLQSGIRLVHLHNSLVKGSRRRFGDITTFHTDLNKPYRCADNLRYWIKAAELRWEVKLSLNVLDLVYEKQPDVWQTFDAALLKWSAAVREELSSELFADKEADHQTRPQLQIDGED
ncbi:hypothetical protein MBLNU457_7385t1 [Dothideomycetes sp. NU457]